MTRTRSYSLPYRIYRRLRYLRYVRRKKKAARRDISRSHRLELKAREAEVKKLDRLVREEIRNKDASLKREQSLSKKIRRRNSREQFLSCLRISLKNLQTAFSARGIYQVRDRLTERKAQSKDSIKVLVNSTSIFILAYLGLWLLSQLTTILAASFFSYPTILYYHRLYFDISQSAWFQDSVITIFMAGPLVCLILGLIALALFRAHREGTGLFRLFLWWLIMHAVALVSGGLVSGVIFEGGLGYVMDWTYTTDPQKVVVMAVALAGMIISGLLLSGPFLFTANSYYTELSPKNRHPFLWAQLILPYLLGSAVITAVRQPEWMIYDALALLLQVIAIIAVAGQLWTGQDYYFDEDARSVRYSWPWILAAMILLLVYRIGLASGLRL